MNVELYLAGSSQLPVEAYLIQHGHFNPNLKFFLRPNEPTRPKIPLKTIQG